MRTTTFLLLLSISSIVQANDLTGRELVQKAMDQWRGLTSHGVSTMTIHRPDWERSMTLESWSKGDKTTLVRVVAPAKDEGNGTLLIDTNLWTYAPRINRVIKVPSSMMSQSWMGSDFSNKDIAKSTDIIDQYDHEITDTTQRDEHVVYTVTSIPHEDAAVVWGKEVLVVRDDFVLIEQQFWDQDGELVKKLEAVEIAEMGGRPVARILRMGKVETPEEWTQLTTDEIEFDADLPDHLFTLSNLRNPRR
ncbi:MAG: outer membrane lipoprotein-sorting protein [Gammaproteobacteria bacterium]|nr:outer membrane lipoprotein-sorting protein [Gammaproteobacteria bacterium]